MSEEIKGAPPIEWVTELYRLQDENAKLKAERDEARAVWDNGVAEMTKSTYAQVSLVTNRLHDTESERDALAADCARHKAEAERARLAGIDECIGILKRRQSHYELYRAGTTMTPQAMPTHPATFAILDELLVFLQGHRERAINAATTTEPK